MTLSRNTLLVDLRFLSSALSFMDIIPSDDTESIETDGKGIKYDPVWILRKYKSEKNNGVRIYLHTVLHCIMRHMFIHSLVNRKCWDLASDMAVENMINELGLKSADTEKAGEEAGILRTVKRETGMLTAEKIYRFLLDGGFSQRQMDEAASLFRSDDHRGWYTPVDTAEKDGDDDGDKNGNAGWQERQMPGQNSESPNGMNGEEGRSGRSDSGRGDRESEDGKGESEGDSKGALKPMPGSEDLEQEWKDLSESIEEDLDTFSKNIGQSAGSLVQNLREVNREKYDYESFLKKFAVRGEVMKTSEDEFDYIFYTYGMKLYRNIPLIEPLEYRDAKRIKEFVIAIDTSGSCSGELVQIFAKKTYNVLKSTDSFFSKVNIHILQCDSTVQHDEKITSQEEFDRYIKEMKIYGGGGTDFRPVFRYVDEMVKNHEFTNLKGIIYFTDGIGIFPEKKPEYETAFVFVNDEFKDPIVPPWAIKLVLQKEDI